MLTLLKRGFGLLLIILLAGSLSACGGLLSGGNSRANVPLSKELVSQLASIGSSPKQGMMIRVFKQSSELEVWKRTQSGEYKLLKTYEICAWSGDLGPKIKEGDYQSPEGFYTISPGLMNPNSKYFLAMNTGFPNKFDRANERTGSNLMVHGDCKSVGCFAMRDDGIAEIYALARETFRGGNPNFQVQIFPFRMTADNLAKQAGSPHLPYWKNIKEGYDLFELNRTPPSWDVCEKRYAFNVSSAAPLDPVGACPAGATDQRLAERQAADDAVLSAAVSRYTDGQAKQAEAEGKAEAERAAIQARGEAIGGFFSAIVDGGSAPAAAPSNGVAPAPQSRPSKG